MNIEYINITSYRGISSDAEHYYAKRHVQDKDDYDAFLEQEKPYSFNEDLRFYPDRQQAIELCKKDNQMLYGIHAPEISESQIKNMMADGTIRFPSVLDVVKTARAQFPDAILCLYFHESKKMLLDYLNRLLQAKSPVLDEIITLLKEIKTEKNGNQPA